MGKKDFNTKLLGALNQSPEQEETKTDINEIIESIVDIDPIAENIEPKKKTEEIIAIPIVETKSRRLDLLVYPSMHQDMQRIAEMKGMKLNNLVNQVLIDYTKSEESQKYIEAHKKIKG